MRFLWITPDQLCAAGSYIAREWGENGYAVIGIESPTPEVSLFRVVHADGSTFTVAVDRWGNCQTWDTPVGETVRVNEMHQQASAS